VRIDESAGGIDADGFAARSDEPSDGLGGVAEAAADVEDPLAGLWRVPPQGLRAVGAEAGGDDVAELDEAVVEGAVPGGDRLGVGVGCLNDGCHRVPLFSWLARRGR
jgi:hypothetical protein